LPRKTDANNPADWLLIAESELDALRVLAEREAGYTMCRSKLSETLEKVLKAELIRQGWFLEKTHDLERLSGELRARNSDLMTAIDPLCEALTEVYFTGRYPGFDLEDPDWPDFREKLKQVTDLLEAVKAKIGKR
jgi:HEPN domain-containing protein